MSRPTDLKSLVAWYATTEAASRLHTPRSFHRAAAVHRTVAALLLDAHEESDSRDLMAVYHAGYCVECGLKAIILAQTPRAKRDPVAAQLAAGSQGHDLELLRRKLVLTGPPIPPAVHEALRFVRDRWTTRIRYDAGRLRPGEARRFLDRVDTLHAWIDEVTP